jgi:hypothetical protein
VQAQTRQRRGRLYPAAEKIGLNTLKVPIKWSMVEPEKGVYDFSYVDHAKSMAEKHHLKLVLNWFGHYASGDGTLTGELYVPMYIVQDEKSYPRAVDADGIAHHNAASYDYEPIIDRQIRAFRAFMQHIKDVDSQTHTVLMIQVENEIAMFGVDRQNHKLWRDHSPAANKLFNAPVRPDGQTRIIGLSAPRPSEGPTDWQCTTLALLRVCLLFSSECLRYLARVSSWRLCSWGYSNYLRSSHTTKQAPTVTVIRTIRSVLLSPVSRIAPA